MDNFALIISLLEIASYKKSTFDTDTFFGDYLSLYDSYSG